MKKSFISPKDAKRTCKSSHPDEISTNICSSRGGGKHQALDNQTRATLINMVEDILDNISLSLVLSHKQRWKSVKGKSYSAITHFLEKLRELDK